MKRKKISFFVLFILCIAIVILTVTKNKFPTTEIDVKKILNLSELNPGLNLKNLMFSPFAGNIFAIIDSHLFILDAENHRIMKYDQKGSLIKQIGSIGQDDHSLYYPAGICVKGGEIFVLDVSGQKVKIFDIDGNFKTRFDIPQAAESKAIDVMEGNQSIVVASVYKKKNFKDLKLISVYNRNGEKLREFGDIIESSNYTGYTIFNSCLVQYKNECVYGGFNSVPIIFGYGINGNKLFFIDLFSTGIEEIKLIYKEGKKMGADEPNSVKSNQVKCMKYCFGFEIDDDGIIYYSLNYEDMKGLILKIDRAGKVMEKIRLKMDGRDLKIERIHLRKNNRYAVVKPETGKYFWVAF